jgi:hypothetical protein
MYEVNTIWTPKKKISKCRHKHPPPPEIKKFLPYPSEKTQRSKDAEKKRLFQTPSEILVHKGVCILNGWPSHDFGQNCDNRGKCKWSYQQCWVVFSTCAVKMHSWASRHIRCLAWQVSLVCGRLNPLSCI